MFEISGEIFRVEIVLAGDVGEKDWFFIVLFDKLQKLQEGDVLVLAGSIPGSLPSDTYEKIMQQLRKELLGIP